METFDSATSSAAQFAGWAGDHAPHQSQSEDAKAQSSRVGCSTDTRAGQNRVGLSQARTPLTKNLKVNLGLSTWTVDAYDSRSMPALNSKYKRSTASEACRTCHSESCRRSSLASSLTLSEISHDVRTRNKYFSCKQVKTTMTDLNIRSLRRADRRPDCIWSDITNLPVELCIAPFAGA